MEALTDDDGIDETGSAELVNALELDLYVEQMKAPLAQLVAHYQPKATGQSASSLIGGRRLLERHQARSLVRAGQLMWAFLPLQRVLLTRLT